MSDVKSRRGVYLDLNLSPYEFQTPYGEIFKFRSKKKKEIYTRDVVKELEKLNKMIDRHDLGEFIPEEITQLLRKAVYQSFYRKVEG